MKRDILIWFAVMLGIIFIPQPFAIAWKKHDTIDVEGRVTRLYDLCAYASWINIDNYDEEDPIRDIYLGEITGMSAKAWQEIDVENEKPVYIYDDSNLLYPKKGARKIRPVICRYEIFEVDGTYYLKAIYWISAKKDVTTRYIAYYQYTSLSEDVIDAMNE